MSASDGQDPLVNRRLTRRQLLAAGAIGGVGLATGGSALALQSKSGGPATPLSTMMQETWVPGWCRGMHRSMMMLVTCTL